MASAGVHTSTRLSFDVGSSHSHSNMTTRHIGLGSKGNGLAALGALLLGAVSATAQCAQWVPVDGYPGLAGPNASRHPVAVTELVTWDPDAGGPDYPVLLASGTFSVAGSSFTYDGAKFDVVTGAWSPWAPVSHLVGVTAQTILLNGDEVFARGSTIESWDGTSWTPLGSGMNGAILALERLTNGDIVAGGDFTTAGGVSASHIARWDGTAWSPMGTGMDATVRALTTLPNGDLVAGGSFTTADGVAADFIARWDGTTWSPLGTGMNGAVRAQIALPTGELFVVGSFTTAGGIAASRVACWDGTAWSPLGSGFDSVAHRLFQVTNGDLVVYGDFTMAGGVSAASLARWDGAAWSALGAGPGLAIWAVGQLPAGDLLVGCNAGYEPNNRALLRWDNTDWVPLGAGIDREVRALTTLPDGCVIAGGAFVQAGAVAARHIARWDGAVWSTLDTGVNGTVRALVTVPCGDVVAGGDFDTAGGVAASYVATWDGTVWSPMGTGMNAPVHALLVLPNGDVIAAGEFTTADGIGADRIARWNGTLWSPLGGGLNGSVRALLVLGNGDVIAGGDFTVADGVAASRVARWDGVAWSALGAGTNSRVSCLLGLGNGDVVAGGQFTIAGGISAVHVARWDGSTWSPLGTSFTANATGVSALAAMPDGDVVAADFGYVFSPPGQPVGSMQRWNGTSWSLLGAALGGPVYAFAMQPEGELLVGGAFTSISGVVSAFFGRCVSTCPATAVPIGLGCPSSGGDNLLTAATLPWVDATFHATATGLPSMAFVIAMTGFTPIAQGMLPLDSVFAEGVAGCDVLVDPLILQVLVADAGTAASQLFLVNTPPLVGLTFRHQMIPIEVDGSGDFEAITATNALELTAGDF